MAGINFKNRTLYHGDNLHFLRGMNSDTIHLIATDPPFNKNRDFHATPDSIADGASFQDRWTWREEIETWTETIVDDHPSVWQTIIGAREVWGPGMGAFLAFMGVRLIEMHRVLRDDGSIYLHCDHTASHYLKVLMDAIFGTVNFRNEIIWAYTGPSNTTRWFPRKHDTILFYAKSGDTPFNRDTVRIPYIRITGTGHSSLARGERSDEEVRALEKRYKDRGKVPEDCWTDIPGGGHISKNERTGYPTQKPLALYERIIKASSNPGDIVLDPFAGCATTPIAAERLKRQWVGIDIWDRAHKTMLDRLEKEGLAVPDSNGDGEMFTFGDVYYSTEPPVRTDDGEIAIPYLPPTTGRVQPRYAPPRRQHGRLLEDVGAVCQGCGNDYTFDPRVLEVDHIRPKSDGGSDAYDNLTLLCPPCNKTKRDQLTLTGLQERNRKGGYLSPEKERNIRHGKPTSSRGCWRSTISAPSLTENRQNVWT